jgi:hypothetical protein
VSRVFEIAGRHNGVKTMLILLIGASALAAFGAVLLGGGPVTP